MTDKIQAAIDAAEAVCRRWDSPDWKDERHTADYIAALRTAVQGLRDVGQPVAWVYWHPSDDTHDGPDTIHKEAVSRFTDDTRAAMQRVGWQFQPLYAAPPSPAQPVTADEHFRFTDAELKALQSHPGALAILMDYHEARQTEADAIWGFEEDKPIGNQLRKQALCERGRSIMAEDLELWDADLLRAFGFSPSPAQSADAERVARDVAYFQAGEEQGKRAAQSAGEVVAWREHVEQRLRTWRQSFVNRSGDQLALDDFMDAQSLDDLIDFVCDEWATPASAPPAVEMPKCDCTTATSPDGARRTYCGSDQMRRAVSEGHAFVTLPASAPPAEPTVTTGYAQVIDGPKPQGLEWAEPAAPDVVESLQAKLKLIMEMHGEWNNGMFAANRAREVFIALRAALSTPARRVAARLTEERVREIATLAASMIPDEHEALVAAARQAERESWDAQGLEAPDGA